MALTDLFRRKNTAEQMENEREEQAPHPVLKEDGRASIQTEGPIGKDEIREAANTLHEYKKGKANLEARILENEEWYKMRHWAHMRKANKRWQDEPDPASAWLLNSILNKHADAMDNYPEPNVLPRSQDDEQDAKALSAILPVVLEQNEYEETYSQKWWYKLKSGTGVEGVFWNSAKNNGLGDIEIRKVDLLNLFWEPGVADIQQSRNVFHVALMDNDLLEQKYPFLKGKLGGKAINVSEYAYEDAVDTSRKSVVVDWYYKREVNGRTVLHYCKFVNDEVLYASENDSAYKNRGFYDHGKYPFVFDALFVMEGSPAGFGYIDMMKDAQQYIDKLNSAFLKNALMAGKKRFFIRSDGGVNEEEFADWSNDFVHTTGNLGDDSIREIKVDALPAIYVNVLQQKIDELKETSGNRDFSQGGTTSGVTAASAIAALQEAGSKLSRDMLKSSYRAFTQVCYLCIELMRQFYTEPREFRILGQQGQEEFVRFDNAHLMQRSQGNDFGLDLGYRMPVFDIKVRAQKSSPFSKLSQNEMAKEFFGMGFFNPQMSDQALACIEMMDFEGKQQVISRISQNGTMYQQLQQLQQQMAQMALIIDAQNGTTISQGVQGTVQQPGTPGEASGKMIETNALGKAVQTSKNNTASAAKERAANIAGPKS